MMAHFLYSKEIYMRKPKNTLTLIKSMISTLLRPHNNIDMIFMSCESKSS